jgi:hypothetical protein
VSIIGTHRHFLHEPTPTHRWPYCEPRGDVERPQVALDLQVQCNVAKRSHIVGAILGAKRETSARQAIVNGDMLRRRRHILWNKQMSLVLALPVYKRNLNLPPTSSITGSSGMSRIVSQDSRPLAVKLTDT